MKRLALILLLPVLLLAVLLAFLRYAWCIAVNQDKAVRIAVGVDRLANVAANGDPDETISSRAGRGTQESKPSWCVLCRLLDWIEKDHCRKSEGT